MKNLILAINPGSTSTKLSLFDIENDQELVTDTIRHTVEEIGQYERIIDQKDFRTKLILDFMKDHNINLDSLLAIVGRGGLLKPIPGGTYAVTDAMLEDLKAEKYSSHASNLGAVIANEIANEIGINAYIVDPVVVDEMEDIARISGLKGIERRSVIHALNQKAVSRELLKEHNLSYEDSNVIVAHLGGGVSIAAHQKGQMIDTINGLDGEGPYTPERTGELPAYDVAKFMLDNALDLEEMKKYLAGNGGMKSYTGETDMRVILQAIADGDKSNQIYIDGMCYQIAKAIGEMAVVLKGNVDMIILTGGIAYNEYITNKVDEYVSWIKPITVYPGEMEMTALYQGVKRVVDGEETAKVYERV